MAQRYENYPYPIPPFQLKTLNPPEPLSPPRARGFLGVRRLPCRSVCGGWSKGAERHRGRQTGNPCRKSAVDDYRRRLCNDSSPLPFLLPSFSHGSPSNTLMYPFSAVRNRRMESLRPLFSAALSFPSVAVRFSLPQWTIAHRCNAFLMPHRQSRTSRPVLSLPLADCLTQ